MNDFSREQDAALEALSLDLSGARLVVAAVGTTLVARSGSGESWTFDEDGRLLDHRYAGRGRG